MQTDTQSWPLFIDPHPELSADGAYNSDSVYSQADIQNIISYAGAVCSHHVSAPKFNTDGHHTLEGY